MSKLKLPHNALVFVGDGRKGLFLRNEGDENFPNLKTENVFEDENPLTHEQGSEEPGRVSKATVSSQCSAVEAVDWHQIEEHHFTGKVTAAMKQAVRTGKIRALVVVAPPKDARRTQERLSCRRQVARHCRDQQGSDQASGRGDRDAPDQRRLKSVRSWRLCLAQPQRSLRASKSGRHDLDFPGRRLRFRSLAVLERRGDLGNVEPSGRPK
jgi:protein required for attachment to host cells